ncbi:MMPL family transporter [Nocardiopsis sp. CT-R113]|uniref:MMPL family transporter n=1 Tax=Nocardiopsis codii TaxID=3065942 RepID=A0ABU7KAP1_9ACTN|nr:MMPL family transporter [Nocardiopsis sp. CT-R113]MEE2039301.1 MMPL family transporter [Nocardiopsis sp. CT-R113]
MFAGVGRIAVRHRWWVVAFAALLTVVGGVWGTGALSALTGGAGFDDPASESVRADEILAGELGRNAVDVVVLYESDDLAVDDPGFGDEVEAALAGVPRDGIERLDSHFSTGSDAYVSEDGRATYATVQFDTSDDQERVELLGRVADDFEVDGLDVSFGGVTAMTEQVNALTGSDIARAEMLSLPVLVVVMVLIFRSPVAALLPLAVGTVTALGSFVVLRVLTYSVDIAGSVINVITILGLGLAIDYALFMVSRFREELAAGSDVEEAVRRTTATAGRTVAFSGLALAICFTGLILFPARFLSSMGYAGVAVVAFAVLSSVTLLPPLLSLVGRRVDKWRIPWPRERNRGTQDRWYRVAHAVMRRPAAVTLLIVALLLGLGAPFLTANWARPGDWVLPADADARVVTTALAERFGADPSRIMTVAVTLPGPADTAGDELDAYARRLGGVDGVTGSEVTGTAGEQARVTLAYAMDPMAPEARTMVEDLRAVEPPEDAEALVTGMPASRVDIVDMIGERAPWMLLFVGLVSYLVLFLAFGSVLLPLKSIAMNLLSLSAAFGAITLVFQHGFLAGLFGFEAVGVVDANFPVLIVAIAFGLAMDYEVFLLSRVREQWERGVGETEAVAVGLQRTGRIITGVALLMIIVVSGFVTSSIVFMKMIGVGLVIAIAVDATVVRGLLVPATMRLMGPWAWWAPAPLARLWNRYGFREDAGPGPSPAPPDTGDAPAGPAADRTGEPVR